MKTTKATCRNGRAKTNGAIYNANHNCREATRLRESHIDPTKMKQNFYLQMEKDKIIKHEGGQGGFDAIQHERKRYAELFGAGVEAKNQRYIKSGHREDCKTTDDLYNNKRTTPIETLLQIGDYNSDIDPLKRRQALVKASIQLYNELRELGGYVPLSFSLHMDEKSPHIHMRGVFVHTNKDGCLEPNQTKALQEMGFGIPDPTKPKDRYNNELISFSDTVRERFYQLCEKQGLIINRTVKEPSKRGLEVQEYKYKQASKKLLNAVEMAEQLLEGVNNELIQQLALEFVCTIKKTPDGEPFLRDYFYNKYVPEQLDKLQQYTDFRNLCEDVQYECQDGFDFSDDEITLER